MAKIKFETVVTVDKVREVHRGLMSLTAESVFVGVPAAKAERQDAAEMNNATLAYIHDKGSPAANIPQREFMRPGLEEGKGRFLPLLKQAGQKALEGDKEAVSRLLHAVGLIASSAVRRKITEGPFTPLKPSTIRAKGGKERPLIKTGQMRNAVTYVIRKVSGK